MSVFLILQLKRSSEQKTINDNKINSIELDENAENDEEDKSQNYEAGDGESSMNELSQNMETIFMAIDDDNLAPKSAGKTNYSNSKLDLPITDLPEVFMC